MTRLGLLFLLCLLVSTVFFPKHASAQSDPTATPPSVIAPIQTATTRPDGAVVHVVGFGQKLPEIAKAYGVTVEQIQRLNGLPPDSSSLFSGQKLLIIPKGDAAFSQPVTITPTQPAATEPPIQIVASHTPQPSAPTLVAPAEIPSDMAMILPLAGGLILLGGCLLLVAAFAIRRKQ